MKKGQHSYKMARDLLILEDIGTDLPDASGTRAYLALTNDDMKMEILFEFFDDDPLNPALVANPSLTLMRVTERAAAHWSIGRI